MISAAVGVGVGVAHADTPPPTPPPRTHVAATSSAAAGRLSLPAGLAVGVEIGEPASATVRWVTSGGRVGVGAALGTGTLAGLGLAARADVTFAVATLHRGRSMVVPVQVGLGVRHYRHGYDPASIDELDDAHTGVLATVAIGVARAGGLELYVQGAPGYDLHRTAACSIGSGPRSLCPHAQSSRAFVQLMIGTRWYFGRR